MRALLAGLSLVALTACTEPVATQTVESTSENMSQAVEKAYVTMKPYAYASYVAKRCRSIKLKPGLRQQQERDTRAVFAEFGVSDREARAALRTFSKKRAQDDAFAFLAEYQIVVNDPETWCIAGRKMMSDGDEYGQFLMPV